LSNYTRSTNFTAKDSLSSGNPSKVILGSEHDAEYDAIATAIASKLDGIDTQSTETVIETGDSVVFYDTSATFHKRITAENLRKSLSNLSNLYSFRASSGTTTTVNNITTTNINLSIENFDTNSNFASNEYTVPVTGLYLIGGHCYGTINPANAATAVYYIRVNTSYYYISNFLLDASINQIVSGSGTILIRLTAGQTVGLSVFHNGTNAMTMGAGSSNYLWGYFIREYA